MLRSEESRVQVQCSSNAEPAAPCSMTSIGQNSDSDEEWDDVEPRAPEAAAAEAGATAADELRGPALRTSVRELMAQVRREQVAFEDRLYRQLTDSGLVLSSVVQGNGAWFSARGDKVTASNFGVVCGISDYATPRDLWQLLTGRIADPFRGNSDTRRGNLLEPRALEWYRRHCLGVRRGAEAEAKTKTKGPELKAHRAGARAEAEAEAEAEVRSTGFWVDQQKSFLGGSPDGLCGEDGLVEIKCPRLRPHAAIPAAYMAQMQGQLHFTKRVWCDFVSFHEKEGVAVFRVWYSETFWAWMYPQLERFFACVQGDVQPPECSEPRPSRQAFALALCRVEQTHKAVPTTTSTSSSTSSSSSSSSSA